jgi:hypothetical protein
MNGILLSRRAGGDPSAVGAEGEGGHIPLMSGEAREPPPAGHMPEVDFLIASGRQKGPVRAESKGDDIPLSNVGPENLFSNQIPEHNFLRPSQGKITAGRTHRLGVNRAPARKDRERSEKAGRPRQRERGGLGADRRGPAATGEMNYGEKKESGPKSAMPSIHPLYS